MKLSQLLKREALFYDLQVKDKEDAIKTLLSACDLSSEDISESEILENLFEREAEQSTGIGDGMAFPHARIKGLSRIHIVIGVTKKPLDFASLDRKPVNFIVLMLVDHAKPNELLKTRAAIAKLFAQPDIRSKMLNAKSDEELWNIIISCNIEVDYEITAIDIMRPYYAWITPETTIYNAARELHKHHLDCIPVIDENKVFHGTISCYDIFSYGLPAFFNNLHVISFVKHMNPFEKYFDVDKTLEVTEILNKKEWKEQIIPADATLMEIIFEMTVKNKEFLYVLSEDNKLRGVLDRYSIIDKIIIAR